MALRPIALDFCDEKFTIGDVRAVYESFGSLHIILNQLNLVIFKTKF